VNRGSPFQLAILRISDNSPGVNKHFAVFCEFGIDGGGCGDGRVLLSCVFEFEFAANVDSGPAPEQVRPVLSNSSNRRFVERPGQLPRRKLGEFVRRPKRS
jgi:hypothetical protein